MTEMRNDQYFEASDGRILPLDLQDDDTAAQAALSLTYRDESAIPNLSASDVREQARVLGLGEIPWSDEALQLWLESY